MRNSVMCMSFAVSLVCHAAEPPIQSTTLQFSNITHEAYFQLPEGPVGLQVLSSTLEATTITTSAWESALDFQVGGSFKQGDIYRLTMDMLPRSGFQITGFLFSATVNGELYTATVDNNDPRFHVISPAYAANIVDISLPDGQGGYSNFHLDNVAAPTELLFERHDLAIVNATSFIFDTHVFLESMYGYYDFYDPETDELFSSKLPAYAALSLSNPRLTIYTEAAPVPEPATWAMLLAGIGMGVIARRRIVAC